ncbi:MAG: hypothetical protein QGH90_00315 [Candidatus Poseidoniaceae archaeon]|jgi:hypothetical protein|nr:hypothetical protein [Candidatus Poseidoniaceae archaeon]MDP7000322.1 hypothetical protein [Candidatus Poseidoniaceae archaeon]
MGEKPFAWLGSMFGMDDPSQVLPQIKRYVEDGRLEISEVMSLELVAKLQAQKKRELDAQSWLVDAARIAADVLEKRNKFPRALAAAMTLVKERNALRKMLAAIDADAVATLDTQAAEDFVQAGRIAAQCGKLSKAIKLANKANKTVPKHLGAAIICAHSHALAKKNMRGASKPVLKLVKRLNRAGPVIRNGGEFLLQPEGQPATDLNWLLTCIDYWLNQEMNLADKPATALTAVAVDYRAQIAAIEAGEQVANARLQAAVDKLNPSEDYHAYSRN